MATGFKFISFSEFPGAYDSWPDVTNLGNGGTEPQIAVLPDESPLAPGFVLYHGDNFGKTPGALHTICFDTEKGQWVRTGRPKYIAGIINKIGPATTIDDLKAMVFEEIDTSMPESKPLTESNVADIQGVGVNFVISSADGEKYKITALCGPSRRIAAKGLTWRQAMEWAAGEVEKQVAAEKGLPHELRPLTDAEIRETIYKDGDWYQAAQLEFLGGTVALFVSEDAANEGLRAMAVFNGGVKARGWKCKFVDGQHLGEFPPGTDYYDALHRLIEWARASK